MPGNDDTTTKASKKKDTIPTASAANKDGNDDSTIEKRKVQHKHDWNNFYSHLTYPAERSEKVARFHYLEGPSSSAQILLILRFCFPKNPD